MSGVRHSCEFEQVLFDSLSGSDLSKDDPLEFDFEGVFNSIVSDSFFFSLFLSFSAATCLCM